MRQASTSASAKRIVKNTEIHYAAPILTSAWVWATNIRIGSMARCVKKTVKDESQGTNPSEAKPPQRQHRSARRSPFAEIWPDTSSQIYRPWLNWPNRHLRRHSDWLTPGKQAYRQTHLSMPSYACLPSVKCTPLPLTVWAMIIVG